jgi:tRNA A37 methylthiotransferase MiaB
VTRVSLHTFGCKANQYDTEVVRQALEAAGATVVEDWAQSDVAVVNSCTVTHVSEAKMRGLVRRIARANPSVRTIVMGCAATLDDGTIAALPNVTGVMEGTDPERGLDALGLPPVKAPLVLQSFDRGARSAQPHWREERVAPAHPKRSWRKRSPWAHITRRSY